MVCYHYHLQSYKKTKIVAQNLQENSKNSIFFVISQQFCILWLKMSQGQVTDIYRNRYWGIKEKSIKGNRSISVYIYKRGGLILPLFLVYLKT